MGARCTTILEWGGALDCSLSNPSVIDCLFFDNVAQIANRAFERRFDVKILETQ